MTLKIRLLIILCALSFVCKFDTLAQENKAQPYNRLQYHKYQWQVVHTKDYHIYFPKGYNVLCAYVANKLPSTVALIKKKMGTAISKELNIIIYPSTDQLYETNIGSFETQQYTLPSIVLKGNRIILAYTGSYQALQNQLNKAVVRAIWEEQFIENIGDQIMATIKQDKLPYWFTEGMIEFFATGWNIPDEDLLKKNFDQKVFSGWHEVISYQAKLSGKAFCYFLAQQYYPSAPMQLFLQLRKKKSLPRAARLVTKKKLDILLQQCFNFYQNRFKVKTAAMNDANTSANKITIAKQKGVISKIVISHSRKIVAYISATHNKRTVWLQQASGGKAVKVISYKLPPWITSHTDDIYPLIQWQDDDKILLVVMPQKGNMRLLKFSTTANLIQDNILYGADGVTSVQNLSQYLQLLTAYKKGQSDIIGYDDRKEKYTAYTDDAYDDCQPALNSVNNQLLFISKRKLKRHSEGTTPLQDSMYDVHGIFQLKDKEVLPVVTDTLSYLQWNTPIALQDGGLLASYTKAGSNHLMLVNPDHTTTVIVTPKPYVISGNMLSFYEVLSDSIMIEQYDLTEWIRNNRVRSFESSWLRDYHKNKAEFAKEDSILNAANDMKPSFFDGVLNPKDSKEKSQYTKDSATISFRYDSKKIRGYLLQLHSAYFTAKVNNDYFINRYQPFLNYQGQFKFPEVGAMADGGIADLFENHHFSIAYRLPAGSEGSAFRVHYENTKKITDWGVSWFRKVETLKLDPNRNWVDENGYPYPNTAKVKTNNYEIFVHHPLSYYLSLDLTTALRHDRTVFLATDKYPLIYHDINSTWNTSTISGTLNKLNSTLPSLHKGFKGKIIVDLFKGFNQAKVGLYSIGINLQYHQPIYRYITVVARLQTGYSGGGARVLYNMGGVDNNFTVKVDSTVHFQQSAPYAFTTLITPLRGFIQNSLYGNQYTLINLDVYFPIFETLIPIETPLQSINELQLGLFTDVAQAKETWRKGAENQWRTAIGFSARTNLAGYPLRVDMGFPAGFSGRPVWYLSLSMR